MIVTTWTTVFSPGCRSMTGRIRERVMAEGAGRSRFVASAQLNSFSEIPANPGTV